MHSFLFTEILKTRRDAQTRRHAFQAAENRRRTATMIDEHLHKLHVQVQAGRPEHQHQGQFDSDNTAVKELRDDARMESDAAMQDDYYAKREMNEAELRLFELERSLDAIESGEERWEAFSDLGPLPYGTNTRTFTDGFGRPRYFKQTYPPPSPPPGYRYPRPPTPPRSKEPITSRHEPSPKSSAIEAWHASIDAALADLTSVTQIPRAPIWTCDRDRAARLPLCPKLALGLCGCTLDALFKGKDLKAERRKWHPDKWSRVPGAYREVVQKDVAEVFKWCDGKHKEMEKSGLGKKNFWNQDGDS